MRQQRLPGKQRPMPRTSTMLTQVLLPSTAHKMFLQSAFGIKPDGTAITDLSSLPCKLKKYNNVKTYDKYNDMIHVPWFLVVTTNKTRNCDLEVMVCGGELLFLPRRLAGGKKKHRV
jgi:hypothetical protein